MSNASDPHARATGIGSRELAEAGVHLDPIDAERERRLELINYNVVTYPILRLVGFSILGAIVVLHNTAVLGDEQYRLVLSYAGAVFAYCLLSWVLLRAFYARSLAWAFDLGDVFFVLDLGLIAYAIYASGGERSLLFFALAIRAGDQVHGGVLRTVIFAHAAALSYAILVGWLYFGEARLLDLPAEEAKILFIYATGLWLALSAWPAERIRDRTGAAVRFASEVLARLEIRSRDLAEQTRHARILRRKADGDARARGIAMARLGREFRGPLTRIGSALGGAQTGEGPPANVADIRAAAESMEGLIQRFGDIGTEEREGPTLDSVSLAPLLNQVVAQLRWWLEDREISFRPRVAEPDIGSLRVHADPGWLEEALWNVSWLVVRGAARSAAIDLTAAARAGKVHVTVRDPAARVAASTRMVLRRMAVEGGPHGTAGEEHAAEDERSELLVARSLVAAMGGALTVEVGDREGITVTLALPAAVA
ncbi:MAG: hypothetical protein ABFS34_12060 [Gemmatimonadota bacterium]